MRLFLLFLNFCSFYLSTHCFDFLGITNGYRYLSHQVNEQTSAELSTDVVTTWVEQPVNQFSKRDKRLWLMRVFENLKYWKKNGPVYVFIGGEGEANPGFLKGGMLYELAKETNGAMIMTEHRYYGPTRPLPYTGVKSLKYLSAKQALADIAKVIKRMKGLKVFQKSKFVAIGGSYPGNLAAWLKLLYPDLIDAALASSAPVLAKINFKEYLETVSDAYEQYGTPGCLDFIAKQFQMYADAFKTSEGIENLKKSENICESCNMNIAENQQYFVYSKSGKFMSNAQYGNEQKIKQHCQDIMDSSNASLLDDEFNSYYESVMTNIWNREKNCKEYNFDDVVDHIKYKGDFLTSWVYQMCSEFSYAKSTSSDNQPFSKYIPIETFYKVCTMAYGNKFNEQSIERAVNKSNALYGGLTPNVTHVVFSNGEIDPWHRLGILEDLSYDAPAKFIPRSSHCRDLSSNRPGDPEELVEARKYIKYLLKSWIGIETCDIRGGNKECSQ